VIVSNEISPKDIYNIDEVGLLMGFAQSCRVIYGKDVRKNGALRAYDGGREMVTVIETICTDGTKLWPMVIFRGDSVQEDWIEGGQLSMPDDVLVGYSPNGWTDSSKGLRFLQEFFGPGSVTTRKADGKYRLLIFDGHSSHVTWEFLLYCLQNRIIPFCLPSHSTHKLQPLDVCIFSPLKRYWTDAVWDRFQWGNHLVKNEAFWSILHPAWEMALTKKNILSGFEATGIYPLHRLRVLERLPGYDAYRSIEELAPCAKSMDCSTMSPLTEGLAPLAESIGKFTPSPTATIQGLQENRNSGSNYEPHTPTTEPAIQELATYASNSIERNTPRSRKAREAVHLLAHSAAYHCSTL
jgi:hypothetical protein